MKKTKALYVFLFLSTTAFSQSLGILSDPKLLKEAGIKIIRQAKNVEVAFARVSSDEIETLSGFAHEMGRCAGFQLLDDDQSQSLEKVDQILEKLNQNYLLEKIYEIRFANQEFLVEPHTEIINALDKVNPQSLKEWVTWFSSFKTRYHRGENPNLFVSQLRERIEEILKNTQLKYEVSEFSHRKTPQNSIRVRLQGSTVPNEIVVLGGHMDSILGWGASGPAPGADDNASGSSNLLEALRIIADGNISSQRTLDFIWYAGEEGGLLGSAEIARAYKEANLNVIGVMQLDMTLFPGSGPNSISSIEDFTHSGVRDYLQKLNDIYVKANVIPGDKCGYACSDHASWSGQGYPAVFPFEAMSEKMNRSIHTKNDIVFSGSDFVHSSVFTKLALAFAIDLSNSNLKFVKQ